MNKNKKPGRESEKRKASGKVKRTPGRDVLHHIRRDSRGGGQRGHISPNRLGGTSGRSAGSSTADGTGLGPGSVWMVKRPCWPGWC